MYAYTKKNKKAKLYVSLGCSLFLAVMVGVLMTNEVAKPDEMASKPVVKAVDVPVLSIPKPKQKAIRPYQVDAKIVLDYYDGNESDVANYTLFEGVYRMNQGIDYAYQQEGFDVLSVFDGKVTEVKEDALFGNSITIQSDRLKVTYQSLSPISLKEGDAVKQGDVIGQAAMNIYGKDLGNHVHVVMELDGHLIDPESVYGKQLEELGSE